MRRAVIYDLLVIGGGINGAGIARDAAGRGLATLLVERGDLAGATSSASTGLDESSETLRYATNPMRVIYARDRIRRRSKMVPL